MALSSQKMNLDYIRTFVVLGQSSNMTEASKKLGVNVSYVSRHIKQLEDELGVRLTIPSPKNKDLQLTENGKFFFDKYEKIYNDILMTEKEYRQTQQTDNCKISIGVCADLEDNIVKHTKQLCSSNYCFVYNKNYFDKVNDINNVPLILPVSKTQERIMIDEYFIKIICNKY